MEPRPPHVRRGFTLVELAVVLVIVAALAAMAVQGYRGARLRAHQAVSMNNLRSLVQANLLYAADHGTYVPATEPRNRIRWHGARASAGGKFDPTKGFLSDYLGQSRRVGICPEFRRHLSGPGSWEDGSGGYGYNAVYIGGTPQDPFRPNRPVNVHHPERTIMFATTALAKSKGLQEYPFADPPHWVDPNGQLRGKLQPTVHFRFSGKALIAWCDGHITLETPADTAATNFYGGDNAKFGIGFFGPSEDNGYWNPRR